MYEKENIEFMEKVKLENELRKKKYFEIAQQAKKNRKANHEEYLKKLKSIEQSLKEKEIKTQKEIDIIKK